MNKKIECYFDLKETVKEEETKINIFALLARPAKKLYVRNCGVNNMFVTVYPHLESKFSVIELLEMTDKFKTSFSSHHRLYPSVQVWIYSNKCRCFQNVHSLSITKTSIGNRYHISEFEQYIAKNKMYIRVPCES